MISTTQLQQQTSRESAQPQSLVYQDILNLLKGLESGMGKNEENDRQLLTILEYLEQQICGQE